MSPKITWIYVFSATMFPNPFNVLFTRQILTYKDGPRTEIIQIFLKAVDP